MSRWRGRVGCLRAFYRVRAGASRFRSASVGPCDPVRTGLDGPGGFMLRDVCAPSREGRRCREAAPTQQPSPSTPQLSPPASTETGDRLAQPCAQQLEQLLGRLGAGRAERAIDDERRHRADPELAGGRARRRGPRRRSDRRRASRGPRPRRARPRPPARTSVSWSDDQLALGEVGAQQPLLHRVLEAVLVGQMDDPVPVERRARCARCRSGSRAPRRRPPRSAAAPSRAPARPSCRTSRRALGAVARALGRRVRDRARSSAT